MADTKVRIGGLWRNTSKSGIEYLSGSFGQARILIFKNDERRTEQSPAYTMYLAPDDRRPDAAQESPEDPSAVAF